MTLSARLKCWRPLAAMLAVLFIVFSPTRGSAQERANPYTCSRFIEDWTETQRVVYVEGLKHGYAMAVQYSDALHNRLNSDFVDEYESLATDSVQLESFVIGFYALKKSVRENIEPVLQGPVSELQDRLELLCRRSTNGNKAVAQLMLDALEGMTD